MNPGLISNHILIGDTEKVQINKDGCQSRSFRDPGASCLHQLALFDESIVAPPLAGQWVRFQKKLSEMFRIISQ